MKTIKAIVVDDEENARLIIKNFIADYCPTVEIIDEAEDVKSAVKLINKNQVDLDIMKELSTNSDKLIHHRYKKY
jgi:two-component system LytT family response regulator